MTRTYAVAPNPGDPAPAQSQLVLVYLDTPLNRATHHAALERGREIKQSLPEDKKIRKLIEWLGTPDYTLKTDINGEAFFQSKPQQRVFVVIINGDKVKDVGQGVYIGLKPMDTQRVVCGPANYPTFLATLERF